MGRTSKNVTDRVTALEGSLATIQGTLDELVKSLTCRSEVPAETYNASAEDNEAQSIGTIGRELPNTEEMSDIDRFLFQDGPPLVQTLMVGSENLGDKIKQTDHQAAIQVTDWLVDSGITLPYFFILWFAAPENVRKYLLLVIILRKLAVSEARLNLFAGTISPEGLQEIRNVMDSLNSNEGEPTTETEETAEA